MKINNVFNRFAFVAMAFGMALPTTAAAQDAVNLAGEVLVERTVAENGTQTTFWAEPASVVPGDRLKFTTSYTNSSNEAVEDFVVTNPLPAAIALAQLDDAFVVSIDDGRTFGRLSDLSAMDAQGAARSASLTDVTHVRWTLSELAPGETGDLNYYATVR